MTEAAAASGAGSFAGFITGGAATTLPAQFFVEVLPAIEDEAELRVTLYALYSIQRQRGSLRAVRRSALASEAPLQQVLERLGGGPVLERALAAAVARGTLLTCELQDGDALVLVNHEAGRRALGRLRAGLDAAGGTGRAGGTMARPAGVAERPVAVASVYEQEIGALTPAIAEALADAVGRYPEAWIIDALHLAARRNARSWRYAEAVLRRWQAEGRDDDGLDRGTPEGAARTDGAGGGAGPDPYARLFRSHWP